MISIIYFNIMERSIMENMRSYLNKRYESLSSSLTVLSYTPIIQYIIIIFIPMNFNSVQKLIFLCV